MVAITKRLLAANAPRRAEARGNVFGEFTETVKRASLGQISHALYAVGGEYRRNM